MRHWKSGVLLASANMFGVLANFTVITLLFNSMSLRDYGFLSILLTCISIFQIIFNTQSWQGLLNNTDKPSANLLRKCLLFDVSVSSAGCLLLLIFFTLVSGYISSNLVLPTEFLIATVNVALIPPGALISIIRRDSLFGMQAIVDVLSSASKVCFALLFKDGINTPTTIGLVLVAPEALRWMGYFILSKYTLFDLNSHEEANQNNEFKKIYTFSLWGVLTEIIHLPTAHIDKLLVGSYLGLESLAIWDIVKRCVMAVVPATAVVNQILFPYFVKNRKLFGTKKIISQCLHQCYILTIIIGLFYFVASITLPVWLPLAFSLSNKAYSINDIYFTFALLAFVMTLVLGGTPINALFLSLRHSAFTFYISLIGNLLFLVTGMLLLPHLQMVGASLSLLVSGLSIILIKYFILKFNSNASNTS